MRASKNIIGILFAMFMVSCSYSSLRPEVVDRSDAQRMQTVIFATVVSIDRVIATRKPAIELLLDLDSGKTVSIIQQEGDYSFAVGQRVKIIKNKGKSRVMPLQ